MVLVRFWGADQGGVRWDDERGWVGYGYEVDDVPVALEPCFPGALPLPPPSHEKEDEPDRPGEQDASSRDSPGDDWRFGSSPRLQWTRVDPTSVRTVGWCGGVKNERPRGGWVGHTYPLRAATSEGFSARASCWIGGVAITVVVEDGGASTLRKMLRPGTTELIEPT